MSSTESIPQRESTVVHPTVGLMYLLVRTIILTIHVAIDSRSNHAMIQSCIEVHLVVGIATLHGDALQMLVPVSLRCCQVLVEVVMRSFCIQVLHGTFYAHTRESCHDSHLVAFFSIEHEAGNLRCTYLFALQFDFGLIEFHRLERTREAGCKVYLRTACPTFRESVTADIARVYHFDLRIHSEVPVHGLLQVQDYHRFRLRESIALHTATRSSSQFYIDVIVLQLHTVITGRSFFIVVRELGVNTQTSFSSFVVRKSNRHEKNIVQVAGTCTREVCMAETSDGAVRIEVTRDAVPSAQTIVRTQLHHTEWSLSARISITGKIGTDKRIN